MYNAHSSEMSSEKLRRKHCQVRMFSGHVWIQRFWNIIPENLFASRKGFITKRVSFYHICEAQLRCCNLERKYCNIFWIYTGPRSCSYMKTNNRILGIILCQTGMGHLSRMYTHPNTGSDKNRRVHLTVINRWWQHETQSKY